MLSFPESLLAEMFETLDLEPGSTNSLIRNDGKLMGRYPSAKGPVDMRDHVLFTDYLKSQTASTYVSSASPVDGIARVVSYRAVPETNIIALASVATAGAWRHFHTNVAIVIFIVSPVLIALVFGCIWIIKLLGRAAKRSDELQESVDLNTMLFREIHHRVKNNLQSVQALVRMQDIPDATTVEALCIGSCVATPMAALERCSPEFGTAAKLLESACNKTPGHTVRFPTKGLHGCQLDLQVVGYC